jgi:hypothetical protein
MDVHLQGFSRFGSNGCANCLKVLDLHPYVGAISAREVFLRKYLVSAYFKKLFDMITRWITGLSFFDMAKMEIR